MASPIEQLIGAELTDASGAKHATAGKMADVEAVGIYFSAHWCPPCKRFTPVLAETYKKMKANGKKFEIVFASSDKDQAAFDGYLGEMPWLAIPYSDRKTKDALSKKYKVSGIPSFVIVDAKTGELITDDGRTAITEDPEGDGFPWKPKSLDDVMGAVTTLQNGKGAASTVDKTTALAGKTVGLYFSAHWCGPCRGFTPELIKTYNAMKAAGNDDFEIVFVSSDKDDDAFEGYYEEMPWLALPFENRAAKNDLSKACKVSGIPTLVILGPDGKIINADGRSALGKDPTGANFPWVPPAYTDLEDSSAINDTPTVVAFMEGVTDDAVAAGVEAAIKEAAEANTDKDGIKFTVAKKGDGLAGRVRGLAGLEELGTAPMLMIVDLADEQTYYTAAAADSYDAAAINAFVEAFKAKTLERKSLNF